MRSLFNESILAELNEVDKNFTYLKKHETPNIIPGVSSVQEIFNFLTSRILDKEGSADGTLYFGMSEGLHNYYNYTLHITIKGSTGMFSWRPQYIKANGIWMNETNGILLSVGNRFEYNSCDPKMTVCTNSKYMEGKSRLVQTISIVIPGFRYPK